MINSKKIILIFSLIFILTLPAICAEDNSSEILSDSKIDNFTADIQNASEGDTVEVEGEYDFDVPGSYCTIDKNLTVSTNDSATFHIGFYNEYFKIKSCDVTFRNINFAGSNRAITVENSSLTVINCNFDSTITFISGNVTLINVTVPDSYHRLFETTEDSSNLEKITLINSTFTGRFGIYFEQAIGELNMYNCTFNGIREYASFINAQSATYVNNTLINCYNGIFNTANRINLTGNRIRNSHFALNLKADEIEFVGNSLTNLTEISEITTPTLKIIDSNFTDMDEAEQSFQFIIDSEALSFSGCIINGTHFEMKKYVKISTDKTLFNQSSIKSFENPISVYLKNSRFIGMKDESVIYGVGSRKTTSYIYNCTFTDCFMTVVTSDDLNINFCSYINSMLDSSNTLSLKNSNFTNGTAFIRCHGNTIIDGCSFINNTCDELITASQTNTLSISNSEFINNHVNKLIFAYLKKLSITGNIFSANTANDIVDWNARTKTSDTGITITNNIFSRNYNKKGVISNTLISPAFKKGEEISTITIKNNFYGFNIENEYVLDLLGIAYYPLITSWANLRIDKLDDNHYQLKWQDNKANALKLKDYTVSIKNTKGELIASNVTIKNGVGSFESNESKVYVISSDSQIINPPKATITITKTGSTVEDLKIQIRLTDADGNPLKRKLGITSTDYYNGKAIKDPLTYKNTDSNGIITFTFSKRTDGEFNPHIINVKYADLKHGFNQNSIKFTIAKAKATVRASSVNVIYNSDTLNNVKIISAKTKKSIGGLLGTVKIYKKSKLVKKLTFRTTSLGKLNLANVIKLASGKYKIVIEGKTKYNTFIFTKKTTTLTVKKSKVTVKAPKVTNKHKKSQYFKVTLKNEYKKPIKSVKVKIKVGSKTYNVKTNKKGIAKINTNQLNVGKYTVSITIPYKNYKINAKSKITIKK